VDCLGGGLTTFIPLFESTLSLHWLLVYVFIPYLYHSCFTFFNVARSCDLCGDIDVVDFDVDSTRD
jgi:hypothetical protein